MKKFLVLLSLLFCGLAHADTIDINWRVGDSVYDTSICTVGGDLNVPIPPTKYGYTFRGWKPKYTRIEYIESSGTQWIDTGTNGFLNTKWVVDFMNIVPSDDLASAIIGGNLTDKTCAISILLTLGANTRRTCRFGNKEELVPNNIFYNNTRYTITIDKAGLWLGSNRVLTFNTATGFQTSGTLRLFGLEEAHNSSFRLYSSQIYDNNTLVRDFIPVLDLNNVPCMYDTVSKTLFYNAGTGQFTAGPEVEDE